MNDTSEIVGFSCQMNWKYLTVAVIVVGAVLSSLDSSDPHLLAPINIISSNPLVEQHLEKYRGEIGSDFEGYRGHISKGMPRHHIAKVQDTIPNAGFHQTLLEIGPRLRGYNIYKISCIYSTFILDDILD